MLHWEARLMIKDLYQTGHSIRAVARQTGHSRNTVRRAIRPGPNRPRQKCGRRSPLVPFHDYLQQRYLATGLSGVRLFAELQQMGYAGGINPVWRYLKTLDQPRRALTQATVRFETPPGEQAQVDWAECGHFADEQGVRRKVYAFVMVLSYSRMLYVEFTTSTKVAELIACHQRAFSYFGGAPRRILYDNMKQVRLSPSGEWNPLFLDFLQHHGVTPQTCRPYRPRTKGKVERAIRYVKDNFLKGRVFADLADLRAQGLHWQEQVANLRVHATTQERPVDLWPKENLTDVSDLAPYRLALRYERQVDAEGFVRLSGSRYSVPPQHVGQRVVIEQGAQTVVVRAGDLVIAEHPTATRSGACMARPEHVAAMWQLALERTPAPRLLPDSLLSEQAVAARPLSVYEEVIG